MSACNRKNKGLSLIESIVAIAVLVIIMAGSLQVLDQGSFSSLKTREQTVAYGLARETLEDYFDWDSLRALGVESGHRKGWGHWGGWGHGGKKKGGIGKGSLNAVPHNGDYAVDTVTLNGVTYTMEISVGDGPLPGSLYQDELKQLTATVSWGGTRSVSLTTLKSDFNDHD